MMEEEAKTKWCPYARFQPTNMKGIGAGNRCGDEIKTDENPSSCRCIGSSCMAWKWEAFYPKGAALKEVVSNDCPESVDNCVWVLSEDKTTWGLFPKRGYCGLVGKG